ncbi:MAG: hypothetical protein ACRDV9_00015 [Acidimicrobiia bacterium]
MPTSHHTTRLPPPAEQALSVEPPLRRKQAQKPSKPKTLDGKDSQMRNVSAHLFRRTVAAGAAGIFTLFLAGGTASAFQPADEGGDKGPLCEVAHMTGDAVLIEELCMSGH